MPPNPLSAFPYPHASWIIISEKLWAPGQTQGGQQVCGLLSPLPSSLPSNHSSGLGFKWVGPLYSRQQTARQTRSQQSAVSPGVGWGKNGWAALLTSTLHAAGWEALGDIYKRLPLLLKSHDQTKGQSQQTSNLRNQ